MDMQHPCSLFLCKAKKNIGCGFIPTTFLFPNQASQFSHSNNSTHNTTQHTKRKAPIGTVFRYL